GFDTFSMLSKKDSEEVVQQFTEKNIIEGDLLSKTGLALIQFIKLYAESKIYLKIGDSMFANYQDDEYIMISKNDMTYTIVPLNQDEIVVTLLSKFSDKMENIEDGKVRNKLMTKRRFKEFMDENPDIPAIFYYYIDLDKKENRDAVLFYADNKLQHYNGTLEELTIYPKEYVQQGIESIFHKEVG
ncbi:MAG: hypothetical protein ACLRH5_12680, partial [Intestinibacter bartlettii]